MKEHFSFDAIQKIVVSNLTDGIVLVKLPTEGPDGRGDLILEVDPVIEFVIKLALNAEKLRAVEIDSSGTYVSIRYCHTYSIK